MEGKSEELYVQHQDLVKSYDDKIAEAGKEMQKCADVIRGYFDRVFERVRIVERLSIMPDGLATGRTGRSSRSACRKTSPASQDWPTMSVAASGNGWSRR